MRTAEYSTDETGLGLTFWLSGERSYLGSVLIFACAKRQILMPKPADHEPDIPSIHRFSPVAEGLSSMRETADFVQSLKSAQPTVLTR